jgi:hypothetical protein
VVDVDIGSTRFLGGLRSDEPVALCCAGRNVAGAIRRGSCKPRQPVVPATSVGGPDLVATWDHTGARGGQRVIVVGDRRLISVTPLANNGRIAA